MPAYDYKCNACGVVFETEHSMSTTCANCARCGSTRIERDYSNYCPSFVMKGATVGSLAEINSKKLGSEQIALKQEEKKASRKKAQQKLMEKMGREKFL